MSVLVLAMLQAIVPTGMAQVSDYDFTCQIHRGQEATERLDARVSGGQFVLDSKGEMILRAAGSRKGQPEQTRRVVSFSHDGTSERVGRWNGIASHSYAAGGMSEKTIGMRSSEVFDKLTKQNDWVSPHATGKEIAPDPAEYQFRFEIYSNGPDLLTITKSAGTAIEVYGAGVCETEEPQHPSVKFPVGQSVIITEAIQ